MYKNKNKIYKSLGMKTYFIKGRIREPEAEPEQESERDSSSATKSHTSIRKGGLKQVIFMCFLVKQSNLIFQKLAGKLKMNHTNSYPIRASQGREGGSLRMKLAERNRSAQLLPKEAGASLKKSITFEFQSNSICIMEDNRKSASLQALATANNYHGSTPDTNNSYADKVITDGRSPANGSSSNSMKGSRSSGLQVDICS